MSPQAAEKRREARLRRALRRLGYRLVKSRSATPEQVECGGYMIVNADTEFVEAGGSPIAFSLDLDQVEAWVKEE